MKLSFAALTVLNLSLLVCININQLSTKKTGYHIVTILTDELLSWDFQILTHWGYRTWAIFVWCGGLPQARCQSITYLNMNP